MRRLLAGLGIVLGLLPWALFVVWTGWPTVARSVAVMERFQDTGNEGYFIIKLSLLVLLVLMILQAGLDLLHRRDGASR